MADFKIIIPFILNAEGGYVNNPSDNGHETNKGVTWATWVVFYGDTTASHNQFLAMPPDQWGNIFKAGYWDKIYGGAINSQRVANMIADWVWTSGTYYPEEHIQQLINHIFKKHLAVDWVFGPATIDSINSADEELLYQNLFLRRIQYYHDVVEMAQSKGDHSQDQFLQGWLDRVSRLIEFNMQF